MSTKDIQGQDKVSEWIQKTQGTFSLPEGAIWLMCNEKDEHFVRAKS